MVEEIVMIDKLIKFDFFYNSKDATMSIVHFKSTGSRPFPIFQLLYFLSYSSLGTIFSLFSPSSGTAKLLPISPHLKHSYTRY